MTPPPRWFGPYLGAGASGPVCAGAETGLLVLGPPRSGKTSCVLIPNVLLAPGAVIATSTKLDVLNATLGARSRRGNCWLFDPSGTLTPTDPRLRSLAWSPVTGSADWNSAVATARALSRAARPDAHGESAHWVERAEALIGPLLHAADLAGLGMSWTVRWVLRRDLPEPLNILAHKRSELAHDTLLGIAETDERERSGILSTAASVLGAYRSTAALDQADNPNFDPAAFVHSADTVYVAASADSQDLLAPVVVAFLEAVRAAAYRDTEHRAVVVWALDEVANIAPLPTLPAVVSEGGGQRLVTIASLQDLSQARARWGPAADGFLTLFGAKMLLGGIADVRTLEAVSSIAGDHDVQVQSRTYGKNRWFGTRVPPTVTHSLRRQRILPVETIAQGRPGQALALFGTRPLWITLTPSWQPPWTKSR
ncbi:MAG: type IV secretory system conjugative DNA transfer family protein [Acidimicrobiales bacterium]